MRPINELINKKREAVRLRLGGLSLAQVRAKTGLSVPTIVKAVEEFKSAGWKGLEPETRGRKQSVKANAQQDGNRVLQAIVTAAQQLQRFCSLEDLLVVYSQSNKAISKKTLLRRLATLVPERDHSVVFERMVRFASESSQVAQLSRSRLLVLGFQPIGSGCIFYTLDRRGERRFYFSAEPLSAATLQQQLDLLVPEASPEKPFFVVIKTDSLARYQKLAAWQQVNKERCFLVAQWVLPE